MRLLLASSAGCRAETELLVRFDVDVYKSMTSSRFMDRSPLSSTSLATLFHKRIFHGSYDWILRAWNDGGASLELPLANTPSNNKQRVSRLQTASQPRLGAIAAQP
ncbi:hypothetical protein M427DRAFT_51913 [Gonapodya prolifera JEL478]|uniref:Uncharacterized protein n=1 Tax=Gonapodya prolifera (strain JEL478) TaxID=1344416 RepID=A0A139AW70_GONPJ|nr:hypothetical protein M427DRAFT_51913 [Gonapodya prolifera JEL478]|eukprot:KXS20957.1 hypothetical protein M427DRAFT_51913 [Gonapodya prolifera JEL478]